MNDVRISLDLKPKALTSKNANTCTGDVSVQRIEYQELAKSHAKCREEQKFLIAQINQMAVATSKLAALI